MARANHDTVAMKVSALTVDPCTGLSAVLLEPAEYMPNAGPVVIAVGSNEASAIAALLDGVELERPCTHQLMCTLLADAGARIDHIGIYSVTRGHYRARIHLLLPDGTGATREGRPSDALAVALHTGARIEVAAEILTLSDGPCPDALHPFGPCPDGYQHNGEVARLGRESPYQLIDDGFMGESLTPDEFIDDEFIDDEFIDDEFIDAPFIDAPLIDDALKAAADDEVAEVANQPTTDDFLEVAWLAEAALPQSDTPVAMASPGGPGNSPGLEFVDLADVSDEAFGKWKM